jgi:hypothetical protein
MRPRAQLVKHAATWLSLGLATTFIAAADPDAKPKNACSATQDSDVGQSCAKRPRVANYCYSVQVVNIRG